MERKEPTLTSITPDKDEIAVHQRRINSGHTKKQAAAAAPAVAPSRLGAVALLIAIAALGGSGFLAWQLQQSQVQFLAAEQRIQTLEKKLELSGDESTQSVTAIRAKLKWADSEIRKLWGVSFDTNRKNIAETGKKVAGLEKTLSSVKKQSATAKQLSEGQKASLAALQKQSNEIKQLLHNTVTGVDEQRKRLQSAVDQANRVDQQLAAFKADMADRVKNNEEAIEAIDAYRRNINKDLLQLQQRINQISRPGP